MSDGTILFVEVEPTFFPELYSGSRGPFLRIDDLLINLSQIIYITIADTVVSENQTTQPEEENLAIKQPYVGSN